MAIKFTTSEAEATHCSVLVVGRSGMGKTTLIKTCPKPIIITSEHKLFALRKENIPVIEVKNLDDFNEAIDFVCSKKAKKFETVCIDSVSDLAETLLTTLKKGVSDQRQAYGQMADSILEALDQLKEVKGKHVYVICKAKKLEDEGVVKMVPLMPGRRLGDELAYKFDLVLYLDKNDDEENPYRYLVTEPTYKVDAKGCENLNGIERPDLGRLFKKALGK